MVRRALGRDLQELTTGIHDADHNARQRLAENKRSGHRHGRNKVEPDLAAPERGDNLDCQNE
jgi:hypothetical protein